VIAGRASTLLLANRFAPRASVGEPAAVRESLQLLADSLVCGAVLTADELRWPPEPLRAAVFDALADRALVLAEVCSASPALAALVIEDVVDACEIAWNQRRRMRQGQRVATRLSPMDHAASDAMVSALWEPLAARGVAAELRERWSSPRTLLDRARRAQREAVTPAAVANVARATVMADVYDAVSAWLSTSGDGRSLLARIADRARARAPSRSAALPAAIDRRSRAAWMQARAAQVARAHAQLRGGASPGSARAGALFVAVDRTNGMREDEVVELRASVLVLLALGHALGRVTSLVVEKDRAAALETITGDVDKSALFSLLEEERRVAPMRALSRVLEEDRSALYEADFVVASVRAGLDYVFDPAPSSLLPALERARQEGFRAHLLRPATGGAIPHAALFDMFHFVDVPTAALIEADDKSSLPLR
jgi:hypothetical protein